MLEETSSEGMGFSFEFLVFLVVINYLCATTSLSASKMTNCLSISVGMSSYRSYNNALIKLRM